MHTKTLAKLAAATGLMAMLISGSAAQAMDSPIGGAGAGIYLGADARVITWQVGWKGQTISDTQMLVELWCVAEGEPGAIYYPASTTVNPCVLRDLTRVGHPVVLSAPPSSSPATPGYTYTTGVLPIKQHTACMKASVQWSDTDESRMEDEGCSS